MGCNCGKNKGTQAPGAGAASARRATVYQVISGSTVISEFGSLPEARVAATEANARVKVTSKLVQ